MAKPDFGTKRLCAGCGAKFYDLNRNPIVCPKCETVFVVPVSRPRAEPARAAPVAPVVEPEKETPDVELVSLEDADAEAQGKKPATAKGDEADTGDDVEVEDDDDNMDDSTFIEEEEDGDTDVTDIIGDGIEKEEES
ncbi:MAG: TIGR02300 family protein [Pseudolabrys sp.]